jgi:dihydrofolate reductase
VYCTPRKSLSLNHSVYYVDTITFRHVSRQRSMRRRWTLRLQPPPSVRRHQPAAPLHIFSRSLPEGERDGAIFVREEPGKFVQELRGKKGKDIWLAGGGELTRKFLKEDLVDELYLRIAPVLVGEGIPVFAAGFPQREFTLSESKAYSGGLIALKYERMRGKAPVEAKSRSKSKRKR